MMRQHRELKRQAGDALLFFRMGDFYELFEADAETAAPLLDLVLAAREKDSPQPVPMCGVPFHALEGYLRRCLAAGLSVAIAEQVEDPRAAKGLVRREIVEGVTPGLVANADRLEGAEPGIVRRFTPTIEALPTPDIDSALDAQAAKTAFWNAFKALRPWWAQLPPY